MEVQTTRVLIADDHAIVREGLSTIIKQNAQLRIVGEAKNFTEVLEQLELVVVDVLVLDLGNMGGAPLTLVNRVRRDYPRVAIVVFSSSVDLAPELLQAGVLGYVVKEDLTSQLLAAIQSVRAGKTFLSPMVQDYVEQSDSLRRGYNLAPKELNVLKLLANGLGTLEIAEHMGIDPRSVQNYITTLRRKTGCDERVQLVAWYHRMYGDS